MKSTRDDLSEVRLFCRDCKHLRFLVYQGCFVCDEGVASPYFEEHRKASCAAMKKRWFKRVRKVRI